MNTSPDNPLRPVVSVKVNQIVVELNCGHGVRANDDLFDLQGNHETNTVALVHCSQCETANLEINPINAGELKPSYVPITNVKELTDELRDVYSGIPFIVFGNLVFVSREQS